MKKILITLFFIPLISSCSLIPRVNFNTPGTVPEETTKGKSKGKCKGEARFNEYGEMIYCSSGYYAYEENYNQSERRYSLKEKIINFFRNLTGISFWFILALIILFPSLAGLIIGRIIESIFGIASKSLSATVRAIQKTRKNGKHLEDSLDAEQDEDVKRYIRRLKQNKKIKI